MVEQSVLAPPTNTHQRARGRIEIVVDALSSGKSRLADLRQEGSFRVLFPRNRNDVIETVILNTAGGVTDGDIYHTQCTVKDGAAASLTTQAAERIYGAASQDMGRIRTRLTVGTGASLHWLPQETILFEASRLDRTLDVELSPDARFLMVEPVVFGRKASGEFLHSALFKDRIRIKDPSGAPIYLDAVTLDGDLAATLNHPAIGAGAQAMASLVMVDPMAEQKLNQIRALLPDTAGASLLRKDVFVLRALAEDSYALRKILVPVLNILTNFELPKTWRL